MKSPPTTESSGSSTDGKKASTHPTGTGVKKLPARTKTTAKAAGESPRKARKWQEFFSSADAPSTDDKTVRAALFDVPGEKRPKKDGAEKNGSKDSGESSSDGVKELMAQIYQDLHHIATLQTFKAAAEAQTEKASPATLKDTRLFLWEASVGVTTVISKSLHPRPNIDQC